MKPSQSFSNVAPNRNAPQLSLTIPCSSTFLQDIAGSSPVGMDIISRALLCANNNSHYWCDRHCIQLTKGKAGYHNLHAIELPNAQRILVIEQRENGKPYYMPFRFFNDHNSYEIYLNKLREHKSKGQTQFCSTCKPCEFMIQTTQVEVVKAQSPLAWLLERARNVVGGKSDMQPAMA